jgi:hypothetical protein
MGKKEWCPIEGPNDDGLIHEARKLLPPSLLFTHAEEVKALFEAAPFVLEKINDPLDLEMDGGLFWIYWLITAECPDPLKLKDHEIFALLAIHEARRGARHKGRYPIALALLHLAQKRALRSEITSLEPDAARGRRWRERQSALAESRHKAEAHERGERDAAIIRAAKELKKRNEKRTINSISRALSSDYGLSPRRIIDIIQPHLK